jgi:type I restriction enzyme, S subunit
MVKISAGAVRELRIPLPDLKDQEHLLSALDCVSHQLANESAELVKLRRLKQGLVDDLLSGRVAISTAAA